MLQNQIESVSCDAFFEGTSPLFKRIWGIEFREKFEHYYLHNPYGRAVCVVKKDERGEVEGCIAGFPVPFISSTERPKGLFLGDLMVRPESRNFFLARDLFRFIHSLAGRLGYHFVYGTGTRTARAVAKLAGYQMLTSRLRMTRVLLPAGYLGYRLGLYYPESRIIAQVGETARLIERWLRNQFTRHNGTLEFIEVDGPRIFEQVRVPPFRGESETVPDFDQLGLAWALGRNPHRLFLARRRSSKGLSETQLLLEETRERRNTLNVLYAMGNTAELGELLSLACKEARKKGFLAISTLVSTQWHVASFYQRSGFSQRAEEDIIMVCPTDGNDTPRNLVIYPIATDQ